MTDTVALDVWLGRITKKHVFGKGGTYAKGNGNLTLRTEGELLLTSGSSQVRVPAGTEVCIFRKPASHGQDIIGTIYLEDRLVNIYPGGVLSKRTYPRGIRY